MDAFREITKEELVRENGALRKSEEIYWSFFCSSLDGIYQTNAEGNFILMNKAGAKIFGHEDPEEMTGLSALNYWRDPGDREIFSAELRQKKSVSAYPIHAKKRSGEPIELESTSRILEDEEGAFLGIEGILRDVTERKRAEEALRESEEKFRSLFNNAEVGMYRTKLDGSELLDMNEKFLEIFGRTREEVKGKPSVIHWTDPAEREEMVSRLKTQGHVNDFECSMLNKDGEVRYCLTSVRLYRGQGTLEGSIIDITERKRAEEALRESEARLKLAQDAAHAGVWEWNLITDENFWSEELWKLYGLEPNSCKPSYEAWKQTIHPEDQQKAEQALQQAARNREELDAEWRVKTDNGKERWIMARGRPILDAAGNVIKYIGIDIDITERKKAEGALRSYAEQHRSILQAATDGFWMTDIQGRLLEVNEAYCRMSGYSSHELLAMRIPDLEADETADHLRKIMALGEQRFESRNRRKDGSIFDVEVSVQYWPTKGGRFVVFLRDITERKRADENTSKSLREKETLLRELYHRTKNNMQVISSLLNLQSAQSGDPFVQQIFKETKSRISSMSLVHEKLYQSKDLSKVNLREYIHDLASSVLKSYQTGTDRLELKTDIDDISLSIDAVTPCGLILNELMSNSLKYAFPDGQRGVIQISVHNLDDGEMELRFSDNGIGLPEGLDVRNSKSLGMQLICILAESQLQGRLDVKTHHGAGVEHTLRFRDVKARKIAT